MVAQHFVKRDRIWSFLAPYFPAFILNTEIIYEFSPNAEKYGPEKLQIRTLGILNSVSVLFKRPFLVFILNLT